MSELTRIGDFSLQWGESVTWDERRGRLYFVDCGTQLLHWLEGAAPPLQSLKMPTIPTGIVLAEDGRLVVALGDGLYVIDVDAESIDLLTPYPEGLGGRANDAAADLHGNLVTGTLNVAPGPGSYWWYSASEGWRLLDDGIGNANGPVVLDRDGDQTLVFSDTLASTVYSYAYDGERGTVRDRAVLADTTGTGGFPDGACADDQGGVWSCLPGAGKIVRHAPGGQQDVIEAGVEMPSDVTFGGADLDRLFFVSIAIPLAGVEVTSPYAGALMAVDATGYRGRPEPRFRLSA